MTAAADQRARSRRAALRALEKARRAAEAAGVPLSDWEDTFLESLGERLDAYGRAFADPAKGDAAAALSNLQTVKLKEIRAKAQGKPRRGLQRRAPLKPNGRKPRA